MHTHGLETIDPRIPPMPGRSTSGFHRDEANIACTKREAPRGFRRVARKGELHPTISNAFAAEFRTCHSASFLTYRGRRGESSPTLGGVQQISNFFPEFREHEELSMSHRRIVTYSFESNPIRSISMR